MRTVRVSDQGRSQAATRAASRSCQRERFSEMVRICHSTNDYQPAPPLWNPKKGSLVSSPPNHFASAAFFLLSGTQHSPQKRTGRAMSDLARTQRRAPTLSCPRCGTAMEAIVTIEPTLGEPGLIGYECPKCVYVTSELVQPTGGAKPVR